MITTEADQHVSLAKVLRILVMRRPRDAGALSTHLGPELTLSEDALDLIDQFRASAELIDELVEPFLDYVRQVAMPSMAHRYLRYAYSLAKRGASTHVQELVMAQLVRAGSWRQAKQLALSMPRQNLTVFEVMGMIRVYTSGAISSSDEDNYVLNLAFEYRGQSGVAEVQALIAERNKRHSADIM